MATCYVDVMGMSTKVRYWGKALDEPFEPHETELMLMVPGSPGVTDFYLEFLEAMWNNYERKIPVWTIAYGGLYDLPGERSELPDFFSEKEQRYDLDGQVQHKIEFVRKFVPAHVRIHMISHSIGSWISLQMLRNPQLKAKVINCYFLFPALDELAASPRGKAFRYLMMPFYHPFEIFYKTVVMRMPEELLKLILSMFFYVSRLPLKIYPVIYTQIVSPAPGQRSYRLAASAMKRIRQLDVKLIKEHADILHIYYGTVDSWVPVHRYENMRRLVPEVDARLCDHRMEHGFVLEHSQLMADVLRDWMETNRKLSNNNCGCKGGGVGACAGCADCDKATATATNPTDGHITNGDRAQVL